ncbi:unnamed protein product [Cylindrotheca closterium]|uniref:G-protein coupled receptors family 1 profile domain-containing protein n=1 Tax=Cylindrotheca closterium TaxID=2856 RepID=A0AAD2CL74_9STRA|nr:unnamed protein product [Cylindrotheca closterium]
MNSSALETNNNTGDASTADTTYMPSTAQQRVISSIQLPLSILSLIGCSLIVYNLTRRSSKNSPHRRIMLALSVSNIISTLGWMLQPFLVPTDVPDPWVYAVGNDASCVMLGAISQFSIMSQPLYLGLLSVYFLATVKFGVKQREFEVNYETWFHVSIVSLVVSTVIGGIALGLFRPNVVSPGCWVNHEPQDERCNGRWCRERTFAFAFGAVPALASLFVIFVSNLMLYIHVRTTVMEGQKKSIIIERKLRSFQTSFISSSPQQESTSRTFSDSQHQEGACEAVGIRQEAVDASKKYAVSSASFGGKSVMSGGGSVLRSSNKQWKRVRQVGRQAFLYVGAYLTAFSWSFLLHTLIILDFDKHQGIRHAMFPLMVLQAICGGSLGVCLAVIFFNPKLRQARLKYDCEPLWWVLQQVITGEAEKVERFSSISMASSAGRRSFIRHRGRRGDTPIMAMMTKYSPGTWQSKSPEPQVPGAIGTSPKQKTESISNDDMRIEEDYEDADLLTAKMELEHHDNGIEEVNNHESILESIRISFDDDDEEEADLETADTELENHDV